MKRLFFVLLLVFTVCKLIAQPQSPGGLPQLLPVSPTASELIKVGMANVYQSTGAAQTSVPLYQLKLEDFSMPISLSYFSQGTKADQLCSRVGFNWSLNAGGVVTRNVMGMPDEKVPRPAIPASLTANTMEVYNYLENGKTTNGNSDLYDTQPDEFYYSFNGYSGKFVIDDAGNPVIISHENLKITVTKVANDITTITIITPDGVKYLFGGDAYEMSTSDKWMQAAYTPKTGFYLKQITLLTGATITFSYNRRTTYSNTGFSETVTTPNDDPDNMPGVCPGGHFIQSHTWSHQYVTIDACYLSGIQTSTGTSVTFTYENMPDESNDVRLKSLLVFNQSSLLVSNYHFTYTNCSTRVNGYPTGPNNSAVGINGRFFLTSVYQQFLNPDGDDVTPNNIGYTFDYYGDPNSCYSTVTNIYSQDHFGFLNGKLNQNLLPQPAAPDDFTTTEIQWANKTPDWTYARNGVLKKITYPTTGWEEFFYEANTVAVMQEVPVPTNIVRNLTGSGSLGYGAAHTTYYNSFSVQKNQTGTIHLYTWMGSPCPPGSGAPCGGCKTLYCKITDVTAGNIVKNITGLGLEDFTTTFNLIAGHSYQAEIKMTGPSCFHADITISYDAGVPGPQPINVETGGVRVSKITRNDPLTGNVLNTFFKYASLAEPAKSSGVGYTTKTYRSYSRTFECSAGICGPCSHNVYSSNGMYNLFTLDNSHVYYKSIIKCDDLNYANGGVEYTYHSPVMNVNGFMHRGVYFPNAPDGIVATMNGVLEQTRYFDKDQKTKRLEKDEYEIAVTGDIVRSIHIRRNYSPIPNAPPDPVYFAPFDVREVNYAAGWRKLVSRKVEEYTDALDKLEKTTTFIYAGKENVLPREEITTNSKNEEVKATRKYVTDFTGVSALDAMKNSYKINALVEETNTVGTIEIAKKEITYKDWFNDGKVLVPEIVKTKESDVATGTENRIVFGGYDNSGNIIQMSKKDDQQLTYIWDHAKSLVIAEVKNAPASEVAYTSFEADSKGNWTYAGTPITTEGAITGTKCYWPNETGVIYKSGLNPTTTYIVSYWSKGGEYLINYTTTPVKVGRTSKGWTYYEHEVVTSNGLIVIYGEGLIDEVRLYPKGATMSTFTWTPLIGMTTQCDPNSKILYYEYDNLNRLRIIRDQDDNILKKICYNYAGQVEDCGAPTLHYSSAKSGFFQKACAAGYTGSWVAYSLPAGAFSSYDVQEAESLANAAFNSQGQANANSVGQCIANATVNIRLKNQFVGSGWPAGVTLQFLQNGVVVHTKTYPTTATGQINTTIPSGSYQLKWISPAGNTMSVSYSLSSTFYDGIGGQPVTTPGHIDFPTGTLYIITATNAQ
jgi:hypothetical protein